MSAPADVAELVDAHGSGPCGGNPVEVQVLSSALRSCAGENFDDGSQKVHARSTNVLGGAPARRFGLFERTLAKTIAKHSRRGWRLDKPSLDLPNDSIVALAVAVETLENQPEHVQVVGWL
jgi:hypothetical protein